MNDSVVVNRSVEVDVCTCAYTCDAMSGADFVKQYGNSNLDTLALADLTFKLVESNDPLYRVAAQLVFAVEAFNVEYDKHPLN